MSKPMSKTSARFANAAEQKLVNLLECQARAERMGDTKRAAELGVEIEALKVARDERKAKAPARTEARRQAARDEWYRQQMAIAATKNI